MTSSIPYLERNAPRTLKGRIKGFRVASGRGPIDRLKVGCAFGALRAAYWTVAQIRDRLPADLGSVFIVSDKYRFAYCGIPKAGTKSIHRALLDSPEIGAFSSKWSARDRTFDVRSAFKSYYKFAIVRNPWSRVVSCYCDKISKPPTIGTLQIMASRPGLSPGLSFDAFVQWLCSADGSDECGDRHWISQCLFVTDNTGKIFCDFVGKLENIETDFQTICEAVQLPPVELSHYRKSSNGRGHSSYQDFYNDQTRKLVGKRYERDVDLFRYSFSTAEIARRNEGARSLSHAFAS